MICSACATTNDPSARFCQNCSTDLPATGQTIARKISAPACSSCQRTNPAGARFCVYCATPLAAAPAAPFGTPVQVNISQTTYAPASTGVAPAGTFAAVNNIAQNYHYPVQLNLSQSNVNLLIRGIWFLGIGWWLGLIWTVLAWVCNLTVLLLPLGIWMLNRIPQVMTLQQPRQPQVTVQPGYVLVQQPQHIAFPLRMIWFVLIGSWASLIWMLIAWALTATILFMPIAFWMFNRVPTITTLAAE